MKNGKVFNGLNMVLGIFDKAYCINLDRRPDRLSEVTKELNRVNIPFERFSATDGQTLPGGYNKTYKGEIGGTISHLNVLKKAKEENLSNVLILEDDVEFISNFNDIFQQRMKFVPDNWEMLFFGGNHVGGLSIINPFVAKMNKSYAIHAYAVKNIVFDIIIDHLERSVDRVLGTSEMLKPSVAADYYLAMLHSGTNSYCFKPPLAHQKPGFSDLQQTVVNYDFLKS